MTNEQIRQLFSKHGYYLGFDHYDSDDRSWSDVIHNLPEREYLNTYADDPDFFDFMCFMRAMCIKNAVYYIPTAITNGKEDYFHYEGRVDTAIPLFSTMKNAERLYEHGNIPSMESCKEIKLLDLIDSFDGDVELHINPLTDCLSVRRSYYVDCLALAQSISAERFHKILEKS